MTIMSKEYLSLPKFAKLIGISRFRAYQLCQDNLIKYEKYGYYFFIEKKYAEKLAKLFKEKGKYHTFPRIKRQK